MVQKPTSIQPQCGIGEPPSHLVISKNEILEYSVHLYRGPWIRTFVGHKRRSGRRLCSAMVEKSSLDQQFLRCQVSYYLAHYFTKIIKETHQNCSKYVESQQDFSKISVESQRNFRKTLP